MNPYEAPKASVADIGLEEHPQERPSQVVLAVKLAWAGIILGLSALALGWEYYSSLGSTTSMVIGQAFGFLFAVWVYYKIYHGRNWARILYLAMALLGFLLFASGAVRAQMLAGPLISKISAILNTGITIAVIWLLFTRPGNAWFKRSRRASAA
jgi:hypothetical protein